MLFSSKLEMLIASEINSLGFLFVGLEFDRHSKPDVLRVYADISNGITVNDCGKIGYHLNKVLSVASDLGVQNYVLEVSSPGVERRLFTLSQCEQFLGRKIKLKLQTVVDGKSNIVGVLRSVDQAHNKILIGMDGQDLYFDFDNIARANLVYCKS